MAMPQHLNERDPRVDASRRSPQKRSPAPWIVHRQPRFYRVLSVIWSPSVEGNYVDLKVEVADDRDV